MAKNEWFMAQLKSKAEAYCARAEHCVSDVRRKLEEWCASSEQCDAILSSLLADKYIDQERYSHAYVHDKVAYQGWGRMKIRAGLYAKHIPSNLIDIALASIDDAVYADVLQRVIISKRRTLKSNDPQAREKLLRFCMQRGFTYEEILEVIE
jgi:regulatory protein